MNHIEQKFKFKATFEKIYNSTWTIWIILAIGIYIRVVQYIANRSLWLDEAMLSLNIVHRTLFGLLKPLIYNQAAPIGFLFLEKLAVLIFGPNEYSLRLFPLLSGVIALFLFYKVSRLYIKDKAVPFSVFLFSISYILIRYSSEVKPYSSDVLVALILYLIASPFFSKENGNRKYIIFGIVGALCIWISYPSVFVLAGVGTTIFILYLYSGKWKQIVKLSVIYLFWIINFAIFYTFSLHNLQSHNRLVHALKESFAPSPVESLPKFKWYFYHFYFGTFQYFFRSEVYMVAAFLFIIGFAKILIEKNVKLTAIFSPIVFLLIASLLGKYPIGGRLILFLISPIILITSEGVVELISKYSGKKVVLIIGILLTFISYPLNDTLKALVVPIKKEEIKPAMKYISKNAKKDDTIYVYFGAIPAFKFYSERFNIDKKNCILASWGSKHDLNVFLDEVKKLRGKKRVWFLISHVRPKRKIDEEKFLLFNLDRMGHRIDSRKYIGASVYLYDLTGSKMATLNDP